MVDIDKSQSWHIFDRIARGYDKANRVLSFGLDVQWRKKVHEFLPQTEAIEIIDLACGTGDLALSCAQHCNNIEEIIGVDLSKNMLERARYKIRKAGFQDKISILLGDACSIPLKNDSADAITMGFGIRNVPDPAHAFDEMLRVLKSGGRAIILEFSLPKNFLIRFAYLCYLRYFIPMIGKIITGDKDAYVYLNKTIETFPCGDDFLKMMTDQGFTNPQAQSLTFGAVTVYCVEKP